METTLTFLGTADAFNAGGRGNSCYLIEDSLGCYSVDFGPTALLKCQILGVNLNDLDGVFITHLHGDHIGGIAMLLVHLEFVLERTRPLVIAGPPGVEERLSLLNQSAYPSVMQRGLSYAVNFVQWEVPGTIEVLGRTVSAIRAKHDKLAVATSLRVERGGQTICFSGDTGWQPELAALTQGANIFVCECSMHHPDYWGHLSVDELVSVRDQLHVDNLYLSHLSDASRAAATAQLAALRAHIADDGLVVTVQV